MISLLDATTDANLFAPWFKHRETWSAWFAFPAALFGQPMSAEQHAIYRQCTGRDAPPAGVASEAWLVIGRRGGKSLMLALIAVYLACFFAYRKYLAPGERGTVLVIAASQKQARVIFRFIRGLLTGVPLLAKMIERETLDSFELDNGVCIEVSTASFRTVRGYAVVAALCDEIAFWPTDDAADPDREVLAALRPAMATIPNAMLLCASSPYARRGALYDAHRKHFGQDGDSVLVWHVPTRAMNPTVSQRVIDEAMERDPASAAAEFGAEFRSDIEGFVSREAVEACVMGGVRERAPLAGVSYFAFVDPSGGSADSFTLAIGHRIPGPEGNPGLAIVDAIREVKPPFSPENVVNEFVALLKSYRVSAVTGDRYGGEWAREPFRKLGVNYQLSERPKSDLYRDFLPIVNSQRVALLDNAKLIAQLCLLERRTARGGRDSIDHAPAAHDDIAKAVAGVVVHLSGADDPTNLDWILGPDGADLGLTPREVELAERRQFAMQQMHAHVWSGGGQRPPWSY
jgi:hypothetical protein